MKRKLLIIGASGHGKVVADIAMKMNQWDEIAFLDDDESIDSIMGLSIIDTSKNMQLYIKEYEVFVAIGDNQIRKKVYEQLIVLDATIPNLIHPNAVIGRNVYIDIGTVIMAGVVINSGTKISKGCIINTGATVDHDNDIADFVHISPGAHLAGTVSVGEGTWLGIGSIINNNINITNRCIVGAGAIVVSEITETGTYVGIPAKRIDG